MIPDKLLLSVETGVELVAVGIQHDREPGADVEAGSYEGVEVVRAEVTPVARTSGLFFGAIARGSLVQMISER
jgi:hypothetical protein